jgi:hypothetical protein
MPSPWSVLESVNDVIRLRRVSREGSSCDKASVLSCHIRVYCGGVEVGSRAVA